MRKIGFGFWLLILFSLRLEAAEPEPFFLPVMGRSVLIFNQGAGENRPWYINDHCLIKGNDGRYHLFGITHRKELIPPPWAEHSFAHASSEELWDLPWQKHPRVLGVDKALGETHLWAPQIIEKDGSYYMFYAGGGGHWDSMINLAVSKDLFNWERPAGVNPLFRDFYDARDPMALKVGDEYLLYYCKTYSRGDHRSAVAFRRSRDLIHWSEPEFALALSEDPRLINSGHTESPYVFEYGGKYYLAICSPFYHYRLTRIFVSENPYRFEEKNEVTGLIAHCAEILNFDGKWYASHAGWFYDGAYLAPISWKKAKRFEPQFVFVNAGETKEYLAGKQLAKAGASELTGRFPGNQVLRIDKGGRVGYRIPVPKDAKTIQLFICGTGAYEILLSGKKLDQAKDPASSEGLDLYWLDDPGGWKDGNLDLTIRPAGNSAYQLNFLRLYFVD